MCILVLSCHRIGGRGLLSGIVCVIVVGQPLRLVVRSGGGGWWFGLGLWCVTGNLCVHTLLSVSLVVCSVMLTLLVFLDLHDALPVGHCTRAGSEFVVWQQGRRRGAHRRQNTYVGGLLLSFPKTFVCSVD